jgi:hypothetical protein
MKIHSDTLRITDIQTCVPNGCYLAVFDHKSFGRTSCGYEGSRSREHGYVVRLSGSGKYTMRNIPDKAATWDEWGNFIAAVFERDPEAIVGWYKSREKFIEVTTNEYNRIAKYRRDLLPTHSAPWLAHN